MNKIMRRLDCFLLLISISFISLIPSCANKPMSVSIYEPSWVQTRGPYGGWVPTVSVDSQGHLYAGAWAEPLIVGSSTGLYRSLDNGESWQLLGIEARIRLAPYSSVINSKGHIFIYSMDSMSAGAGVYRSLDMGNSWVRVSNSEMNKLGIVSFAVNSSDHIFAVATPVWPDDDKGGIYRSIDNGASWAKVTDFKAISLAIDSNNRLFAISSEGRVYSSSDNGDSWAMISERFTSAPISPAILVISNDHILVGTFGDGIFMSSDYGANWVQVNDSMNNAEIWALAKDEMGNIFAGDVGHIYRSTDNGKSWVKLNAGVLTSKVLSLACSNGHIYAGTATDGVIHSCDRGEHWNVVGVPLTRVASLFITPDDHVFAETDYGLFRSADNGNNWRKMEFDGSIKAIDSDGAVYANGYYNGASGLWRSTDNGDNWHLVNNVTYPQLAINSDGYLFGSSGLDGVFRSTDNGKSWLQLSSGLSDADIDYVATARDGYVFALSHSSPPPWPSGVDGIFRSDDNGENWIFIGGRSGYWLISNSFGDLFLSNGGLYRSTDLGDSWVYLSNNGLPASTLVRCLAIDLDGHLFVGTYDGVYYSADNGDNWTRINKGLTLISDDIQCIAVNSKNALFAGTGSAGVFRMDQITQ